LLFGKGQSYNGLDKEKWEAEEEIATREKNWKISATFICFVVGGNCCFGCYGVVEG